MIKWVLIRWVHSSAKIPINSSSPQTISVTSKSKQYSFWANFYVLPINFNLFCWVKIAVNDLPALMAFIFAGSSSWVVMSKGFIKNLLKFSVKLSEFPQAKILLSIVMAIVWSKLAEMKAIFFMITIGLTISITIFSLRSKSWLIPRYLQRPQP